MVSNENNPEHKKLVLREKQGRPFKDNSLLSSPLGAGLNPHPGEITNILPQKKHRSPLESTGNFHRKKASCPKYYS